jgi:hypothetical protein
MAFSSPFIIFLGYRRRLHLPADLPAKRVRIGASRVALCPGPFGRRFLRGLRRPRHRNPGNRCCSKLRGNSAAAEENPGPCRRRSVNFGERCRSGLAPASRGYRVDRPLYCSAHQNPSVGRLGRYPSLAFYAPVSRRPVLWRGGLIANRGATPAPIGLPSLGVYSMRFR